MKKHSVSVSRLLAIATVVFFLGGCKSEKKTVDKKKESIQASIFIGDDIFLAKEKLVDMGFRIKSGPIFATKNRDYYLMIVDCGAMPNGLETFKYTVGIKSNGELIDGVIKAGIDKRITSIE